MNPYAHRALFVSPRPRGFSLIELLVAVAVIGILATIALPSYQDYMQRVRRSAAQSFMLDIVNKQQQYLMDARTYTTNLNTLYGTTTSPVPADVSPYYSIAVAAETGGTIAATFKITATAQGSQTPDGDLTLNYLGVKTPVDKWK